MYRVEVSPGAVVESSNTAALNDVFGSIRLVNNVAYAADGDGRVHALDASNFNSGGFANLTGFPFRDITNHTAGQLASHANAVHSSPYVDFGGLIYFGDDDGHLYALQTNGSLYAGYPYALTGTEKLTTSPLYRSGVIVIGSDSGNVYFVDQHNASNLPSLFFRYVVGAGAVSSVSYNANSGNYMVGTADGKLVFIPSMADPTPSNN
jgi:outer membrane protein assembly factor BamB